MTPDVLYLLKALLTSICAGWVIYLLGVRVLWRWFEAPAASRVNAARETARPRGRRGEVPGRFTSSRPVSIPRRASTDRQHLLTVVRAGERHV